MKLRIVSLVAALLLAINISGVYAADGNSTNVSYMVDKLMEKLADVTQADVDKALGKFSDMGKHWSRQYVGKLAVLEIVQGMSDGTFQPDNTEKIDEFIAMTVHSLGFKPESGSKYWADPFIRIAKEQKLIDPNEYMDFQRPILREEAAKIIVRAAMLKETGVNSNLYNYIRGKIKDYPEIGDKYKQSVLDAYALGLISGSAGGYFKPNDSLKRGEASTIVLRNLDTSLRTPLKPDSSGVLVLKDLYGKSYEVYPSSQPETFNTAVALNNCTGKSKGYLSVVYNPFDQIINGGFYHDKDSYDQSDLNIEMSFSIHNSDDKSIEHPYTITVFKPEEVKKLHRDVISETFKSLFENDSDKAMEEFDKYLELSLKRGPAKESTYYFNKRKTLFYIVENENKFTVWIYGREN